MTTYQTKNNLTPNWHPIKKPAEIAEERLIEAILEKTFPINSYLPAERELAELLGVTRPTLRETLQRLARDGWIEIHQGKPTRVRDYWREGRLGVLSALSEHPNHLPEDFVPHLLQVRLTMAPTYTELAVKNAPDKVVAYLQACSKLDDSPEQYTLFDWELQHEMTLMGENPVFVMILNGFKELFLNLAPHYFSNPQARLHSLKYYKDLADAAEKGNYTKAGSLTAEIMRESLFFWEQTKIG